MIADLAVTTLVGGILFACLSLSNVRQHIVRGFPASTHIGLQVGVGLRNGGLLSRILTAISLLAICTPAAVVAIFLSLLLIAALVATRMRGAMLLSIMAVTVAGLFIQTAPGHFMTVPPARVVALPHIPTAYFLAFDTTVFFP